MIAGMGPFIHLMTVAAKENVINKGFTHPQYDGRYGTLHPLDDSSSEGKRDGVGDSQHDEYEACISVGYVVKLFPYQ